jgi:hypothetical protein
MRKEGGGGCDGAAFLGLGILIGVVSGKTSRSLIRTSDSNVVSRKRAGHGNPGEKKPVLKEEKPLKKLKIFPSSPPSFWL